VVKYQINPGCRKLQMTIGHSKKEKQGGKKSFIGEMYITDGT
jgi:hypothetical protein